jgi:hypothetical protein
MHHEDYNWKCLPTEISVSTMELLSRLSNNITDNMLHDTMWLYYLCQIRLMKWNIEWFKTIADKYGNHVRKFMWQPRGWGKVDISMTFHLRAFFFFYYITSWQFSKLRDYELSKKCQLHPTQTVATQTPVHSCHTHPQSFWITQYKVMKQVVPLLNIWNGFWILDSSHKIQWIIDILLTLDIVNQGKNLMCDVNTLKC